MPVLIKADVDSINGWAELKFPYHPPTISILKQFPGCTWNPDRRVWRAPTNVLGLLKSQLKIIETEKVKLRHAEVPEVIRMKLRDYQLEGAKFLTERRGALLTMEMRVGKTPTSIGAACALLSDGTADAVLVTYPNSVMQTWRDQLRDWANLSLNAFSGGKSLDDAEIEALAKQQYLVLGCHYEILAKRADDLEKILKNKRFILIADEIQRCKNRKIDQTKRLWQLAHADNCVARWGLTGTPIKNRVRDGWAMFEFVGVAQGGSYSRYTERYCDGHLDDNGHWDDTGISKENSEELNTRLSAISYRKTRAEVAAWLPKSDRKVILCDGHASDLKAYRKIEKACAIQLENALSGDVESDLVRELVKATSKAKIPTALERVREHLDRGVKVLVFAHFHETLQLAYAEFGAIQAYCAGGWKTAQERNGEIAAWKAREGAAVLFANSLSSGVGIDLSDAEVAIFLELEWVPADFLQAEARIQDVHQGTRIAPPIFEYILVRGSIDERMANALIAKVSAIENIVGTDVEARGVTSTLRGAGVVDTARLGLENTSRVAIDAALHAVRDRWLKKDSKEDAIAENVAADIVEYWEDKVSDED